MDGWIEGVGGPTHAGVGSGGGCSITSPAMSSSLIGGVRSTCKSDSYLLT